MSSTVSNRVSVRTCYNTPTQSANWQHLYCWYGLQFVKTDTNSYSSLGIVDSYAAVLILQLDVVIRIISELDLHSSWLYSCSRDDGVKSRQSDTACSRFGSKRDSVNAKWIQDPLSHQSALKTGHFSRILISMLELNHFRRRVTYAVTEAVSLPFHKASSWMAQGRA